MLTRFRYILILIAMLITAFLGFKIYNYLFDTTQPTIVLQGLEQDKYYGGDTPCALTSNKSGDITILLDDQSLISNYTMSAGDHGYQFTIPTKTIANGKHTIKALLTDRSYNKNRTNLEKTFYVDNVQLQAALVKGDSDLKVFQGRTLHVQLQVNKPIKQATITALSHTYDCVPESKNSSILEAFIPITCEENPNEYLCGIDIQDNVGNTVHLDNKFQVVMFPFKKVNLTIAPDKVREEEEIGRDSQEFEEYIAKLTEESPKEKLWKGAFCAPIEIQRISSEFGTVRTTQHKGRYAHKALDVINTPKSVVWATQDGTVVVKDRFAASGNTVVIDHGMGVLSMFFHLDDFAKIQNGQKITKGSPLGYIGKTGYATGYHLHWEMRVQNTAVDPMQWTKPIF